MPHDPAGERMSSQVFYRKWRPQTLAEVVGQEPVTTTLANALTTGRVAHAYLFCGPRGTGKTSTGRILAKAVNCLNSNGGEPCNACAMCQASNEGRALDLIEIDGASNRGIDEIRDLREKINFAPNAARYKVYIIDEVHMLTEPAFNALLKTLEEPPPHAIFILATTEIQKVPLTILSRCQRFDFRRLRNSDTANKLRDICEQEGIEPEPQALEMIAKSATGSLRDAENLLEQIILNYGPRFGLDQVNEKLGISTDSRIQQLAEQVLTGDIPAGLATINNVSADGIDLRQFHHGLVEYMRDLLMVKAGVQDAADLPAEELAAMKQLVSSVSMADLARAIKLMAQADFRADPQSTLPLELALVDSVLPAAGRQQKPAATEKVRQAPVPETKQAQAGTGVEEQPEATSNEPRTPEPPRAVGIEPSTAEPPQTVEQIRERWGELISSCEGPGFNRNLKAILKQACSAVALEGNTLVLGFTGTYLKDKIEDQKYRLQVEKKLEEVFGVSYRLRCVLTKAQEAKPEQEPSDPVVQEALRMGARRISEERE
jgi:DNA polymerase-3 subunit gamma/tau